MIIYFFLLKKKICIAVARHQSEAKWRIEPSLLGKLEEKVGDEVACQSLLQLAIPCRACAWVKREADSVPVEGRQQHGRAALLVGI